MNHSIKFTSILFFCFFFKPFLYPMQQQPSNQNLYVSIMMNIQQPPLASTSTKKPTISEQQTQTQQSSTSTRDIRAEQQQQQRERRISRAQSRERQ